MKRLMLRLAAGLALSAACLGAWSAQGLAATVHRVQWGDSLWKLAQRYGTSVEAIQAENGLWGTTIYAGETLRIPAPTPAAAASRGTGAVPASGPGGFTEAEIDLLARLISAEAAGEPYAGQVAVGAVVLNRMRSGIFPNTLAGVIYDPWQFEPVSNGWINVPATASARQAALDAINGWDPTGGALYFFNWYTVRNSFLWSLPLKTTIGAHRFVG